MKKLFYGLLITIVILLSMYGCMNYFWGDMCGNNIINEIESPNKKLKAVIFIRDCGATTGYSTQVSIIKNKEKLDNESGNILIMNDKTDNGLTFENGGALVSALWNNDNELIISLDVRTDFSLKENSFEEVKINYRKLDF
ncbi:MAG: hypothetical protein V4667_10605 [Bacteroidota bacterium]